MARKPGDTINLRVRMPEGLRKRLAAEAERSHRSLNSEIVWRLGQSLGPEGAEFIREHETVEEHMKRVLDDIIARYTNERSR
jgi:hypothetical protein